MNNNITAYSISPLVLLVWQYHRRHGDDVDDVIIGTDGGNLRRMPDYNSSTNHMYTDVSMIELQEEIGQQKWNQIDNEGKNHSAIGLVLGIDVTTSLVTLY
jgi:hypothetical protein